jgi:hypothetical protein
MLNLLASQDCTKTFVVHYRIIVAVVSCHPLIFAFISFGLLWKEKLKDICQFKVDFG